jgi:hypothetical protein
MRSLIAVAALAALTGCTSIKSLTYSTKDGESLTLSGYQSTKDLTLERTENGFVVKGIASSATEAQGRAMGTIVGEAVKAAVEGAK